MAVCFVGKNNTQICVSNYVAYFSFDTKSLQGNEKIYAAFDYIALAVSCKQERSI